MNGATEISRALRDNRTLTSLSLAGNLFGDDGAEHVAGCLSSGSAVALLE